VIERALPPIGGLLPAGVAGAAGGAVAGVAVGGAGAGAGAEADAGTDPGAEVAHGGVALGGGVSGEAVGRVRVPAGSGDAGRGGPAAGGEAGLRDAAAGGTVPGGTAPGDVVSGGTAAGGTVEGTLTHFDAQGRAVMVDVSGKPETARTATARARVSMAAATLRLVRGGTAAKGDVLGTARLAGIMAAKRTAELIPLCHPLPISAVTLELAAVEDAGGCGVEVAATVRTTGRTGVEMEALTAASVAALTVYDMLKAVDRAMRVDGLRVVHKDGGKSGAFRQD
jgi:cyclic pyranopterin phosphate synthase